MERNQTDFLVRGSKGDKGRSSTGGSMQERGGYVARSRKAERYSFLHRKDISFLCVDIMKLK